MKEELTIYQANRREVVFDVTHGAFSAAFEALLGRTDVGAFADAGGPSRRRCHTAPTPFHLENTAAFIHRMDPATVQTAAQPLARTVRIQIITPPGALSRSPSE